jgi:hypothetical protein
LEQNFFVSDKTARFLEQFKLLMVCKIDPTGQRLCRSSPLHRPARFRGSTLQPAEGQLSLLWPELGLSRQLGRERRSFVSEFNFFTVVEIGTIVASNLLLLLPGKHFFV